MSLGHAWSAPGVARGGLIIFKKEEEEKREREGKKGNIEKGGQNSELIKTN